MYEYKFVQLEMKGIVERKPREDYHEIIEKYAKEGWRLVQIFSPSTDSSGVAMYDEIIFEKQV